jgi:hypothetical protein
MAPLKTKASAWWRREETPRLAATISSWRKASKLRPRPDPLTACMM